MANSVWVNLNSGSSTSGGSTFSGQMIGPAADNTAAPPFSFTGDLTSGYASSAVGTLSLVTAGTTRLSVNSTAATATVPFYGPNGGAAGPTYSYAGDTDTGTHWVAANIFAFTTGGSDRFELNANHIQLASDVDLNWTSTTNPNGTVDLTLARGAPNTLDLKNGTAAQTFNVYGYLSGSRLGYGSLLTTVGAVTLSGATSATTNIIPAGATVINIATTTTTTITGASGYQVGDGSDADRYGDITGTAVGTHSGSADGTADPRWWSSSARSVTLTAKTSNFTGGVVQVIVYYESATGA